MNRKPMHSHLAKAFLLILGCSIALTGCFDSVVCENLVGPSSVLLDANVWNGTWRSVEDDGNGVLRLSANITRLSVNQDGSLSVSDQKNTIAAIPRKYRNYTIINWRHDGKTLKDCYDWIVFQKYGNVAIVCIPKASAFQRLVSEGSLSGYFPNEKDVAPPPPKNGQPEGKAQHVYGDVKLLHLTDEHLRIIFHESPVSSSLFSQSLLVRQSDQESVGRSLAQAAELADELGIVIPKYQPPPVSVSPVPAPPVTKQ